MPKETVVESGKPERRLESKARPLPQQLGNPSSYVGTPAVGTSRAVSSAGISSTGPPNTLVNIRPESMPLNAPCASYSSSAIAS